MLSIRRADEQDIELIRKLTFKIWPVTYSSIISPQQMDYMLDMMYSPASLSKQMNEAGCTFIIAYEENEPVGFASFNEEIPRTWKLNKLYVLPNQQGKGTGKKMISYIIDAIKPLQADSLQLQVNRANSAKLFYEKLGFTVIKTADFDIGNGYFMNDFVMELKL